MSNINLYGIKIHPPAQKKKKKKKKEEADSAV